MQKKPILVAGSINIDLVVGVERLPRLGETLTGTGLENHPGGKGANQAAAIGRLGWPVQMIGRIGSDVFGEQLRGHISGAGVDISAVMRSEGASGLAMIAVTPEGENSIIVTPGANAAVSEKDVEDHIKLIRNASCVLTQLEIPLDTVARLAAICARERVPLILDPAPAQFMPPEMLRQVAWITPNDTEAQRIAESDGSLRSERDLCALAEYLMGLGPKNVLLKLGDRGAYLATEDGVRALIPAYAVQAVDTTAAGDAFNGAFAVALAGGARPMEAAQFASAAAAISVTRRGALPSMPTHAEVDSFLIERSRQPELTV